MIDFLHFIFVEPWTHVGDWLSRILSVLMILLTIMVIGLLSMLGYHIIDSVGIETKQGVAEVVYHQYHYAYTSIVSTGKTTIPIYHPERWELGFKINNLVDGFDVSELTYKRVDNGIKYDVEYGIGRISNELYIESVNFQKQSNE